MIDDFVVHQVLNSLLIEYKQLKISYTALRHKWSMNELISACVSEEGRVNHKKGRKSLNIAPASKKGNNHNKDSNFKGEIIRVMIKTHPAL